MSSIKIGEKYLDRDGNIVEIIGTNYADYDYPFLGDNKEYYSYYGKVDIWENSPRDLVKKVQ